jgi:tetratricopeptide (TPR) repeat protein
MLVCEQNYYEILGIDGSSNFQQIKKAYYRRAKECHPDLFNNSSDKTEEFKRVVNAFDVLSDPEKKHRYDACISDGRNSNVTTATDDQNSIMDTAADDILEEIIVGNTYPINTSLATILLDLAKTEIFITFREGKNLFFEKRAMAAKPFLLNAVSMSPHNIIFRVYLARCLAMIKDYEQAKRHYRTALAMGHNRIPAQNMFRIKREFEFVKKAHRPLWSMLSGFFEKPESTFITDTDQKLIQQMNRMLTKLEKEQNERKKRQLKE